MREEILDCTSSDAVPSKGLNTSTFHVDKDGIVKIAYTDSHGVTATKTMQVYANVENKIRHITRCYRYYTGTTNTGYAQSFNESGVLVNGIVITTVD